MGKKVEFFLLTFSCSGGVPKSPISFALLWEFQHICRDHIRMTRKCKVCKSTKWFYWLVDGNHSEDDELIKEKIKTEELYEMTAVLPCWTGTDAVLSSVAIQIWTCLLLLGKGTPLATHHPKFIREPRNLGVITSNAECQNKAVRVSAAPASILKMQLLILLSLSSLSLSRSRLLYQSSYCRGLCCSLHRVTQPTAKPGRAYRP